MSQKTHPKALKSPGATDFASVKTLLRLAWPENKKLSFAALLMGISAAATAGYAYLLGPVIRSIFLESNPTHLETLNPVLKLAALIGAADPWLVGTIIVSLAFVKGTSHFGHTALTGQANQKILHDLRARLYSGLLTINPLSPLARSKGELNSRFTIDMEAVQGSIAKGLVSFIRDVLQILALAGLAITLDPVLGLVGLVAFPPVAVLIVRIGKRLRKRRAEVHSEFGQLSTIVDETASGLAVVQSFGAENLVANRFASNSKKLMSATVRAIVVKAISSPINEILGACALALTLWYAEGRIAGGALSPEGFISFFTALFLLYQPIKGLGQAQHAVQSGLAALERLAVLEPKAEQSKSASQEAIPSPPINEVRLEQASASYNDKVNVLKDLYLTIKANSKIAVVGRSGVGKSTLLHMLQGFVPLDSGKMLVNGHPVASNPKTSRHIFSLVAQEPFLFDDTIAMNVRCGRPGATATEVKEACGAAGVIPFADEMSEGLNSNVGPGGKDLSLGQRQRVCLARALLSKTPVLLFDEVTASLDGETEQKLVESLDKFLKKRAVLIVTHRLATAKWADRVLLLENGHIEELEPQSLVENNERIDRLFGKQSTD